MKKLQRSWRGNAVTVTGRLVERKMDVLNHVTFANIVNGCVTTTWPAVMPSACSMNFWKWVGALSLLTTSSKNNSLITGSVVSHTNGTRVRMMQFRDKLNQLQHLLQWTSLGTSMSFISFLNRGDHLIARVLAPGTFFRSLP